MKRQIKENKNFRKKTWKEVEKAGQWDITAGQILILGSAGQILI